MPEKFAIRDTVAENKSGRDNFGQLIGTIQAENVYLNDASRPERPSEPKHKTGTEGDAPTISQPKSDDAVPNLQFAFAQGQVRFGACAFRWSEGGIRTLTIAVRNRPNADHSVDLSKIKAHLTLGHQFPSTVISSAYWIGKEHNQIDIEVGREEHLMVAQFSSTRELTLYENLFAYPSESLEWNSPLATTMEEEPQPKKIAWLNNTELIGELFILSKGIGVTDTLAHRKFRIFRGDDGGTDLIPYNVIWLD